VSITNTRELPTTQLHAVDDMLNTVSTCVYSVNGTYYRSERPHMSSHLTAEPEKGSQYLSDKIQLAAVSLQTQTRAGGIVTSSNSGDWPR
jgi:hypothetical protein